MAHPTIDAGERLTRLATVMLDTNPDYAISAVYGRASRGEAFADDVAALVAALRPGVILAFDARRRR